MNAKAEAELAAIEADKIICEKTPWLEHHDPNCKWCATFAGG